MSAIFSQKHRRLLQNRLMIDFFALLDLRPRRQLVLRDHRIDGRDLLAVDTDAALLDEPAPEAEEDLLSVLLPQTEVAFSLPDRVEAGAAVTFVITGPDIAQILPQLDGAASPEALREELRAVLAQGDYPERTVTAQAPIEALESGYRLRNSYALIDGLYGGLPGIVAEALPAAQETGREEA